jgi:hypothetical protein
VIERFRHTGNASATPRYWASKDNAVVGILHKTWRKHVLRGTTRLFPFGPSRKCPGLQNRRLPEQPVISRSRVLCFQSSPCILVVVETPGLGQTLCKSYDSTSSRPKNCMFAQATVHRAWSGSYLNCSTDSRR